MEELQEVTYGVRHSDAGYANLRNVHYVTSEAAIRQARIMARKHGPGFYPVQVTTTVEIEVI